MAGLPDSGRTLRRGGALGKRPHDAIEFTTGLDQEKAREARASVNRHVAAQMNVTVTLPFSGGCACGAIRFECSAAPIGMVNCHCRDCQKASGGSFSPTVIVPAAALRLVQGEPTYHQVRAESGHTARRAFCAYCGTPLFAASTAKRDCAGIKAGSLDDPSWFKPEADVWTCSAQPWDHMDPAVPKFVKGRLPPRDV